MGNNFSITEKPIMEMAQRLVGAGKRVGLTEAQTLCFSAALSSVGITAEMGGSAFTNPSSVQAYHASPSMSSPGCPYDNAAMENFFGTLKTECLYRARFTTRAEVEQLVSEYVDFYNFDRISLKNGLTPVEIRGKTV